MDCSDCIECEVPADPALLISATLYLMTCHAARPCTRLAAMIRCHLCALNKRDDLPTMLRATAAQLVARWDQLSVAVPPQAGVWSRLGILSTRTH